MTPEVNALFQQYGLLGGAVVLVLVLGIPKLIDYLSKRGDLDLKRKIEEVDDDKTEETLDYETRQIANRLARVAFDREEQLSRLKSEYEAQSELLRLTRKELETCRDVQVTEYQRHEQALLEEIAARENTIAKLHNDVLILETMLKTEKD